MVPNIGYIGSDSRSMEGLGKHFKRHTLNSNAQKRDLGLQGLGFIGLAGGGRRVAGGTCARGGHLEGADGSRVAKTGFLSTNYLKLITKIGIYSK